MPIPRHAAFTLIELLIVVAIIAILAAIAVPNFLEAQTRSKVSRAKADLRTLGTAMEAYAVDQNHYPPDWDSNVHGVFLPKGEWKTYANLTTPVAYISSPPLDPFNRDIKLGGYYDYYGEDAVRRDPTSAEALSWQKRGVRWFSYSYGPDLKDQSLGGDQDTALDNTYDPTNGTTSLGDFGRSNIGLLPPS
jgi:type II secretion system protein G